MRAGRQIAVVAPFFGRDLYGRKERFAFEFVTHLALEGAAVEVIATTARPEAPAENFFRAGVDYTEQFPIYRFRVGSPDRAAYAEALLALESEGDAAVDAQRTVIDEGLRSPDLLAHVRRVGDRYDAFLFIDATAATTVHGLAEVAENAVLVPLLDDDPVARVPAVAEAVSRARLILCTTDAEAALVAEIFGPAARRRVRVVGLAADIVPLDEIESGRLRRAARLAPYVLATGEDRSLVTALRTRANVVSLAESDEHDRAALFAHASVVAVTADRLGVVPDIVEAWGYGKPPIVPASSPGAAALVDEVGAGVVVRSHEDWLETIGTLPDEHALRALGEPGLRHVRGSGGWPRVAARTLEAIDALAALDDGRSRELLRAQIAFLYPLVQRQRRLIDAMRVSRFWRLRDAWFGFRRRIGIGPDIDPLPLPPSDDRAGELAAAGDEYQLFRQYHGVRDEDLERMRLTRPFLPWPVTFGIVIDLRGRSLDGVRASLRSLRDQVYDGWRAAIHLGEGVEPEVEDEVRALVGEDERVVVVASGPLERLDGYDFVGPLEPHDRFEPHALYECALALQRRRDAILIYSDEDAIDERNVPSAPWFKPDWSPETMLTRDVVGRPCFLRREPLVANGGVRDVFESASWYEAALRLTDQNDDVLHVPEVLYHRAKRNVVQRQDMLLAVEVALKRRGEEAKVSLAAAGLTLRFAISGSERVCIVIPTRDRAELLAACLRSIFTRTTYREFEVVVIDNGSREPATAHLLESWALHERSRFRVIRDDEPFNFSRLNNRGVAETTAPFIVMLNNDTEVISGDWMEAMLGHARRPRIGAVGALLLYEDGTVQHGGVVLGILGLAGHAHRGFSEHAAGYHGALQLDTNYLAVTGACLMIEKRKYEQVGGLDESLAVSYNDVDLCLKLHAAGYRNVYVPRARLHHYESKSRGGDDSPAKIARAMAEVEQIRTRWPVWSIRDPYYNPNLTVNAEDFGLRL